MRVPLSQNAVTVLEARYLLRDRGGRIIETPEELFRRVARGVAQAEMNYGGTAGVARWEETFHETLTALDFLPNSPTLMNAGTPGGQLSACFVLPVNDSMAEIFESLKLLALIQQTGGGTGFSFSQLRPAGDVVASTGGASSGPVSFMRIFDCATESIRQGGKRRGANMGVLRVDHPDILEFIDAKLEAGSFENFNLSVAVTDDFMRTLREGGSYRLRHPRTGQSSGTLDAGAVMERIATAAWQSGDPGLIFLDAINRANPTPELGAIDATNPCGEVPLLPYEACNLGSINVAHMVQESGEAFRIDWDKLQACVRIAIRFLDDVIEVGHWPSPLIAAMARNNRKIGLGVMGFAELLILLGIPYGSGAAVKLAEEIGRFLAEHARSTSRELARERGVFPNWNRSIFAAQGLPLRNATCLSIAPTGTISIIAGTSASIEPLFALAYRREHVLGDSTLVELNSLFSRHARALGLSADQLHEVQLRGTVSGLEFMPPQTKALFRTALEIAPDEHMNVQAAFQKHVDNAVSKTINLADSATPADVSAIFRQAWELGLKGVTVYRYGSKRYQVLRLGSDQTVHRDHLSRCPPQGCRL